MWVTVMEIHAKNHYVPKVYLRNWANEDKKIWVYRRLVSSDKVPVWEQKHIDSFAYMHHLYSYEEEGVIDDRIEQWLDLEFEAPAKSVFDKVLSSERLREADYKILIRFLAAQSLRTPAAFTRIRQIATEKFPSIVNDVVRKAESELHRMGAAKFKEHCRQSNAGNAIPAKISIGVDDNIMKVEMFAGRSLWLDNLQRLLKDRMDILMRHKWRVFEVAQGILLPTSDDPVINLNYYSENNYDFNGGWKRRGSEIIMPLSSKHFMYTRIGDSRSLKQYDRDESLSSLVYKFILEHSMLQVYSASKLDNIQRIIPRTIDAEQFTRISSEMQKWHDQNSESERNMQDEP